MKNDDGSGDDRFRAPLTRETYLEIRRRLQLGQKQHDIAADLGLNQGRVSEVNTGQRGNDPRQPTLF